MHPVRRPKSAAVAAIFLPCRDLEPEAGWALGKKKRRREEGQVPAAARQTRLELAVSSIMQRTGGQPWQALLCEAPDREFQLVAGREPVTRSGSPSANFESRNW